MSGRTCLTIVLAAGEGTRMRSSRPKALHEIAGRSLLGHVLTAVANASIAVVVGPEHDDVAANARVYAPQAQTFVQAERRGTAHAVLAAKAAIERGADDILVIFGDTPLIRPQTLESFAPRSPAARLSRCWGSAADPTGYGRLVTEGGELIAIVEHADATEEQRAIPLCNGGLMAFDGKVALQILERISNDNRKGEFYLTDAVKIAREMKRETVALEVTEDEVSGINTKAQLAAMEATMQQRLRQAALEAGVTLVAPETVHLAADTKLGRDVTIEPYVVFGSASRSRTAPPSARSRIWPAPMSAKTPSSVPMRGFVPVRGSKRASTSAISSRSRRRRSRPAPRPTT